MKLLDLIKQFGQANYNYGLFNSTNKLQKQYDAERMDLFKQITEQVSVEPEVKPEICVNTDKLNGSGEYYYNTKLSELFTLNNLIPQLGTKIDFVEGKELAQYEVNQVYYIVKERIAINIYLDEY